MQSIYYFYLEGFTMNKKIIFSLLLVQAATIFSIKTARATTVADKDDWSWLLGGNNATTTAPSTNSSSATQQPISAEQFIGQLPSLSKSEKQKVLFAILSENSPVSLPSSSDEAVNTYLKKLDMCLHSLENIIKNSSTVTVFKGTDLGKQLNTYLSSKLSLALTLVS